jgi:hypothetical protein
MVLRQLQAHDARVIWVKSDPRNVEPRMSQMGADFCAGMRPLVSKRRMDSVSAFVLGQ